MDAVIYSAKAQVTQQIAQLSPHQRAVALARLLDHDHEENVASTVRNVVAFVHAHIPVLRADGLEGEVVTGEGLAEQ